MNSNNLFKFYSWWSYLLYLWKIILVINWNVQRFLFYNLILCCCAFFIPSLFGFLFLFLFFLKFFQSNFLRKISAIFLHFFLILFSFDLKKFLIRLFVLYRQIIPTLGCYFCKFNNTIIWVAFCDRLLLLLEKQ